MTPLELEGFLCPTAEFKPGEDSKNEGLKWGEQRRGRDRSTSQPPETAELDSPKTTATSHGTHTHTHTHTSAAIQTKAKNDTSLLIVF